MALSRSLSITPDAGDPLYEVVSHLGAILMQVDPAHDAIIIEHVQAARDIAIKLYRDSHEEHADA